MLWPEGATLAPHVGAGVETRDEVEGDVHKHVSWDGKAAVNTFYLCFQRGEINLIWLLDPGFDFDLIPFHI